MNGNSYKVHRVATGEQTIKQHDDVSFYNSTASTGTLATPRTTWESMCAYQVHERVLFQNTFCVRPFRQQISSILWCTLIVYIQVLQSAWQSTKYSSCANVGLLRLPSMANRIQLAVLADLSVRSHRRLIVFFIINKNNIWKKVSQT